MIKFNLNVVFERFNMGFGTVALTSVFSDRYSPRKYKINIALMRVPRLRLFLAALLHGSSRDDYMRPLSPPLCFFDHRV